MHLIGMRGGGGAGGHGVRNIARWPCPGNRGSLRTHSAYTMHADWHFQVSHILVARKWWFVLTHVVVEVAFIVLFMLL